MTASDPTIPVGTLGIIGFMGLRILWTIFYGNRYYVYSRPMSCL